MQVINYNAKDYVIKHIIPKDKQNNIEFLKDKYKADIAFANQTTIFFGEELQDLIYEDIDFNSLSSSELIKEVVLLYNNSYEPIEELIEKIIKKIQFHQPNISTDEIKNEIKTYINTI